MNISEAEIRRKLDTGDFSDWKYREEAAEFLLERLALTKEALEFYADKENWDDDKFNPTIWDDGNIDLGKKAREALEKLK